MANLMKQCFLKFMDEKGIEYTDRDENVVEVAYSGVNVRAIPIYVDFDDNGSQCVAFKCWEIANFKNKLAAGLIACNELNKKWRWVKFYIDNDGDIIADNDSIVSSDTCGSECFEIVRRMVNIIDESYQTIMQALWS